MCTLTTEYRLLKNTHRKNGTGAYLQNGVFDKQNMKGGDTNGKSNNDCTGVGCANGNKSSESLRACEAAGVSYYKYRNKDFDSGGCIPQMVKRPSCKKLSKTEIHTKDVKL